MFRFKVIRNSQHVVHFASPVLSSSQQCVFSIVHLEYKTCCAALTNTQKPDWKNHFNLRIYFIELLVALQKVQPKKLIQNLFKYISLILI